MISSPTVLILGAGSSAHCGYPLGSGMVSNICRLKAGSTLDDIPFDKSEVCEFINRLSRSGYYSIDAFLADTPEHLDLGKFLIARELSKSEELDRLFPPSNSGWYQYLFNQLLVDGKPDFAKNNLSIVTFNYDRSLEAYLHTATMNRFRMSSSEATECLAAIPIIHPHGILGPYPDKPYSKPNSREDLAERANDIKVIHELENEKDTFCSIDFEIAHQHLTKAKRIYFLGFGFHNENIERFRFFNEGNLKGVQLNATTYGLGQISYVNLTKDLATYGFPPKQIRYDPNTNCNYFFSRTASLV